MLFAAKLDDRGISVVTNCTVSEMLTAICFITNSLYERLEGANKYAFKEAFLRSARDELPFLSKAERCKKAKELEKEAAEKMKDSETSDDDDVVKKFFKGLKGLFDDD